MKLLITFDFFVFVTLPFPQLGCTVFQKSRNASESPQVLISSIAHPPLTLFVDEQNIDWWSEYCSSIQSKLALQTITRLEWIKHFDVTVLLNPALVPAAAPSCVRLLKLHQNFQVAISPPSALNSSAFNFEQTTILLHFLDRLGPQELILTKLHQLQKSWRPVGYPSYFILASPYIFANESRIQSELLQAWASLVAVDMDVYIWTHFENFTVRNLYEIYAVKNVTFVRDLLLAPSLPHSQTAGKEPMANDIANSIGQQMLRRSNFGKATIIGTNVDNPDYEEATKFRHFPNTTYVEFESGFEVFIYRYLRDGLNFTEVALVWDSYVKQGPNGSLVGLAIPINNGTADVTIINGEFILWRVAGPDGLTYLQPIFFNLLIACFRQPPASSIRNIFLETFSNTLWLSLIALWVILCLALNASIQFNRMLNPMRMLHADHQDLHPRDSWLWAISATCQQGWHTTPHSGPARTIFLLGFCSSMITYTAYSAALVATLSIKVIPVKSFGDLLQHEFNLLSDNKIPTAKFIVESLEDHGTISKIPNSSRIVEIAEKINDLKKGRTAIVSESDAFYPVLTKRGITEFYACSKLSVVPYDPKPVLSAFMVKRGSPFRSYLNLKIIQMRERGVMLVLRKRYLDTTTFKCSDEGSQQRDSITIKDVLTAYAALLIGFVVSTTSFVVEKLGYRE